MNGRGRFGTAGLLVALGLVLAGAVSAQVRPERGGPTARPVAPVGVPTPKKPDLPVRGGQICAVAYEDRNANGRRDGGEGPLAGQSFTIANAAGAQLAQGASGGDGRFCTPRPLPFGDYRVRLIPGGGLTNTDPGAASLNAKSVALRTEGAVTVLFGNCRGAGCAGGAGGPGGPARSGEGGQICAVAYDDRNGNGRRDAGEGPLAGQSFTIANAAGAQLAQGASGGDGRFCTPRPLPFGDYRVRLIPGGGWTNTDPGKASPNVRSVSLRTEGAVTVLFGNCRGAGCGSRVGASGSPPRGAPRAGTRQGDGQLCITKYNDLNANGQRDVGEPGLAGWYFEVENTDINWYLLTGANGSVCWDPPGAAWLVMESQPGPLQLGWINSDPGGSNPWKYFTFTGDEDLALEFGNWKPATLKLTKTVTSTAPGGGYPTTGLIPGPPGGAFKVSFSCPMASSSSSGGNVSVPAGQTVAINNIPVGAVCTVTEFLPPGNIPYAACLTGSGYWEPPVITGSPITVGEGTNTVTVANRFVCGAQLSLTKTVTSTAPGGGYPTTGLAAGGPPGGAFPVRFNCLPALNGLANVPAGQTVSINYVPVGAVCTVTETPPPGNIPYAACLTGSGYWEPPLISGSPITLASGPNAVTVTNRFVCTPPPPPGKVCVAKYNDLNGDGLRQSTEPGLTGWNFTVKNANGVTVTTLTSTSGYPACSPFILPPGAYTIAEVLPATGWVNTDPGGGAIEPFTVAPGGTANAVFGNVQLGKICVRKYNDVNGNGAWSGASSGPEPFMTGVTFEVRNSSGQIVHTGLTAALGVYCTPSTLMPGVYTVTEIVPNGWTNTQPGGAASITVTIPTPYGGPTEFRFGNQKNPLPGELCVEKYNDLNGDGDQDPGEGPLAGWTFTRSGGGMPSLSGSTNANGRWCPGTDLPPGTYTVTETMQSGWTNTDPVGTPVKTALVVTNQTTIVKFGNQQDPLPGEICVRKYNDLNNNGAFDIGEPPLSGWQFTVRNASNTIVGVGSTGGEGQWCTPDLIPPGTYTVTETPQGGWTNTDPGGSTPVKTVVVGSNAAPTVWFGNRQP